MALTALLKAVVHKGSLCVIDAAGRRTPIGDGSPPEVTVRIPSKARDLAISLNPALKLGEAYMNGHLIVEDGSIYNLLDVLARNYNTARNSPLLAALERIGTALRHTNPIDRDRRNVAHHYDLSGTLYDIFLDADRQYSCAYFKHPDDTLETAQANKKRHIAAKLCLDRPGLRVLDIGSGWGGLGLYLAESFAAQVTGITLSTEQHDLSNRRAAQSPASERVGFNLWDYRELEGQYDRIVSVGMFEHVGKRNYETYFARVRDLLTDDGIALIHSIGYADTPGPINPFIRKYIFPGAALPSLSEVTAAAEKTGLWITDIEVLRLHYAETLRHWREGFTARWDEVAALYDERFCRMWEFYLSLCEIGFRQRTNMVFQMQLTRRVDAAPLTRDYIVDAERRAETADRAPDRATATACAAAQP